MHGNNKQVCNAFFVVEDFDEILCTVTDTFPVSFGPQGEVEHDVSQLGLDRVSIYRPG